MAYSQQKQLETIMPTTETIKQERMHIRLDTLSKQKLEKAASYNHKKLSEFALENNISGLEFLSCIPGTIGGGIRMNSGCFGSEFKDILLSVQAIDRNGKVLTVSKIQTQPDFLRAGEESHFLVPIYEKNQSMNVADYNIIAESDEYAAVPEFPLGSGALLIISVSSYVIFSRNPERITNALGRCSKILARQ